MLFVCFLHFKPKTWQERDQVSRTVSPRLSLFPLCAEIIGCVSAGRRLIVVVSVVMVTIGEQAALLGIVKHKSTTKKLGLGADV